MIMPTIFTIPKPFIDPHVKIIQRNAIKSWLQLGPAYEIFLIGNDMGVAETTEELKIKCFMEVKKNEFGTPLLSSAFGLARAASRANLLIYANADIIFLSDLPAALEKLPKNDFLAAGRRWDLDIKELIDFDDPNWEEKLKEKNKNSGRLHSPAGIDYYIFPKHLLTDLPDFAVGRVGWDNWVIWQAKKKKIPLISLTRSLTAIHQNHGYPAFNKGAERKTNPEAKKNKNLAEAISQIYNLDDADFKLTKAGLRKNYFRWYPFIKRYLKFKLGL